MKVQLVDCKWLGLSHCWDKAHSFVTAMRPSGHLYICIILYVEGWLVGLLDRGLESWLVIELRDTVESLA